MNFSMLVCILAILISVSFAGAKICDDCQNENNKLIFFSVDTLCQVSILPNSIQVSNKNNERNQCFQKCRELTDEEENILTQCCQQGCNKERLMSLNMFAAAAVAGKVKRTAGVSFKKKEEYVTDSGVSSLNETLIANHTDTPSITTTTTTTTVSNPMANNATTVVSTNPTTTRVSNIVVVVSNNAPFTMNKSFRNVIVFTVALLILHNE